MTHSDAKFQPTVCVGSARRRITPDHPIYLAGYGGRDQLSEGAYHDIYVTAVCLRTKERQVVILAADLLQFGLEMVNAIKEKAGAATGLTPDQILLSASHTHTGPVIDEPSLHLYPAVDAYYVEFVIQACTDAIVDAAAAPVPAMVWFGTCVAAFGVNRRRRIGDVMQMAPNPRGVCDAEVSILWAVAEDGKPKAVLFSYACHPTTMGGYLLGADYPGPARDLIENELDGVMSLFVQGCCGDVRPRVVGADGRFVSGTVEDIQAFGRDLGRAVLTGMSVPVFSVGGALSTAIATMNLPLQNGEHVTGTVQTVRIGDFALIGFSGEVCIGYQLRLKRERASKPTIVCGYCNEMNAYIPTANLIPEGGYEPLGSVECYRLPAPFRGEVEEVMLKAALRLCE